MTEHLHVDRPDELRAALELIEPGGMVETTNSSHVSLDHALAEYRRILADPDELREYRETFTIVGGPIYGHGGMHRYYLRIDGHLYFSARHASPRATRNAECLGFRIN